MKKTRAICLVMAAALSLTLVGATDAMAAKKSKSTKIALSKKSAELTVGQKLKLKVKNSKKKVKWSTSKKAVATVSKKGKVTAKKVGKANIIAKVGNKKLKCKITVKKKNNNQTNNLPTVNNSSNTTNMQTLNISSVTVLNSHNIQVQLSAPQVLNVGNFTVKIKSYAQGIYNRELRISEVSSTDNRTYMILLDVDNYISENRYVQVSINNIAGIGTISKETIYSQGAFAYQDTVVYYATQNVAIERIFDIDDGYGYGSLVSVSGLPDGISYVNSASAATGGALSVSDSEIKFEGVPTKTGTFRGNITTKDELGNTYSYEMIWLVGSDKAIAAAYTQSYGIIGSQGYNISKNINIRGGSGMYLYEIQGSSYGLKVDEDGYIYGNLTDAGTYNVTVKITDYEDKSITTTATYTINVVKGKTISGIVKDAAGNAIRNTGVNLYFENKDKASLYQTYASTYTDEKGAYSITLMNGGTYDAYASYSYSRGKLITCQVTGDKSGVDFELPIYALTLATDNDKFDVSGNWYASDDTSYNCYNKIIYLRAGAYELTRTVTMGLIEYTGKINVTVDASTTSVKVEVTEKNMLADKLKGDIKAENAVNISSLNEDYIYYKFVPDVDKTYYFFSEGNYDTYGQLMDENGYNLNSAGYGGENNNFSFSYYCNAGKTYYIGIRNYDDYISSGDNISLIVSEKNYILYGTQNKLKGTVKAEIPLDIIITNEYEYYSFTPETEGYYYFYTTGNYDTYGQLLDSDGDYMSDDDSGNGNNFCMSQYCYRGETYYIGICAYDNYSIGEVELVVSERDPWGYY